MVLRGRSSRLLVLVTLALVTGCATLHPLEPAGIRGRSGRSSPTPIPLAGPQTQPTVPPVLLTVEQGNVLDALQADGVQDVLVEQSNRLAILWLNDTDDLLEHYREIPGQLAFDTRSGMFSILQAQEIANVRVQDQEQVDLEQVNHLVLVVHRKAPLPSGSIQQFNGITALDVQNARMVRVTQGNRVTVILDAERLRNRELSFMDATSRTLNRILGIQDRSGRRPVVASPSPSAPTGRTRLQMVNHWILVLGRDGLMRPFAHRPD